MEYLNNFSHFAQGYFWATILFPVEYYVLKPVIIQVYNDAVQYVSKLKNKLIPNAA